MNSTDVLNLSSLIKRHNFTNRLGKITQIEAGQIFVSNLSDVARIGDRAELSCGGWAEVIRVQADQVRFVIGAAIIPPKLGDWVTLSGGVQIFPCERWLGRIIDPNGSALDDRFLPQGSRPVALCPPPVPASNRATLGTRIATGLAVFNTLLPLVEGQRIGLFAGSGVGKSSLIAQFVRRAEADVIVVALIGERGREVRDFVDHAIGPDGMPRTVVIAATSDMPALLRRQCAWSAMGVAEYFRDCGKRVLLLMDSLTRFADAHREITAQAGELPSLRGYPPSVVPALMALCERAGPSCDRPAITAIFSVLVAGSDMDEPIADIVRGTIDGHVVMDRKIAEQGRFPAIDVLRSVSRSLPKAATDKENAIIFEVRRMIGLYQDNETMIRAGLYQKGSDQLLDTAVKAWPELTKFFCETDHRSIMHSFQKLELILRRAQAIAPHPTN